MRRILINRLDVRRLALLLGGHECVRHILGLHLRVLLLLDFVFPLVDEIVDLFLGAGCNGG